MNKHIGLLSIIGVLGPIGSAGALAPSAAEPSFDGTYRHPIDERQ